MKQIKLYNRDGANLWLENISDSKWQLKVDKEHEYCLKYMIITGDYPKSIEAVDLPGGPFISIGDEFENKYKINKILSPILFEISEKLNNK